MRKEATGRGQQRLETRQRLFAAALEVFRRAGVAACRIDDIAAAAGVSRASFYFHFPTKEDVLLELQRETDERIAATVRALPPQTTLRTVLDRLGAALAAVWQGDAKLFPDVAVAALRSGAAAMVSDREAGAVRVALAARFRSAAERGELKDLLPPELLSDLFLTNALGGMLGWCAAPQVPLQEILKIVTQLFLDGAGLQALSQVAKKRRG